jgi:hypothetical protein
MAKRSGKPADEKAADFCREYRPTSLLQRLASVDELAKVVYAAWKNSLATNGDALRVEGGIVQTFA